MDSFGHSLIRLGAQKIYAFCASFSIVALTNSRMPNERAGTHIMEQKHSQTPLH